MCQIRGSKNNDIQADFSSRSPRPVPVNMVGAAQSFPINIGLLTRLSSDSTM